MRSLVLINQTPCPTEKFSPVQVRPVNYPAKEMQRFCTASPFPLTYKVQSNCFPPQPVWNAPQWTLESSLPPLQVTTSFGVLHASVTSRISCHCESASDSLCCRLCILWTTMLAESLSYPCATRSLRSYGGLKKKKKKLCCIIFWKCFFPRTRKQRIYLQLYGFFFCLFLLLLRKEVKKKD